QLLRGYLQAFDAASAPVIIEIDVATVDPTQLSEPLAKRGIPRPYLRISLGEYIQRPNPPYALGLLRARRKRPHSCRATEQREEPPPPHWRPPKPRTTTYHIQQG